MDVLEIIKHEHREVADLFKEIDACEPGDEQLVSLARDVESRLTLHTQLEEKLFYPRLKESVEEDEERIDVFEAYTEHDLAKRLIELLSSNRKNDEKFKAELNVLGESVKHHVREEESTLFGLARECLEGDELDEIGEAWEEAKGRAQGDEARSSSSRTKSVRGTAGERKSAAPTRR